MNILLALTNFSSLTGSEIYTYELARVLIKKGHFVTIMANNVGGLIADKAKEQGIALAEFFTVPETGFDIIHAAQPGPTTYCLTKFPTTPIVCTIHSSLVWERPIIDDRIGKYICIRPEIQTKITVDHQISPEKTIAIYNGVDRERFNTQGVTDSGTILFVGTNDHLRAQVVQDLTLRAEKIQKTLRLVGMGFPEEPTWNIEEPTKSCFATASIYLGRTTIEGWMCGKPGWIYDVDSKGTIQSIQFTEVPDEETLKKFDIEYMTDKILDIYHEVLK